MKLADLLGSIDENKEVYVYEFGCEDGKTPLLAHYDGKDSIPENFNNCNVKTFTDLAVVTVLVEVPKVNTLAERIDRVMHDYDVYGYQDNDVSVEHVESWMRDNPEGVIEDLLTIIEDYAEQISSLEIEAGYGYKKEGK